MPHDLLEANEHKRSPVSDRNSSSAGGDAGRVNDSVVDSDANVERYLDHLAQLDMPLAMKIELIRALRVIMQSFVDRAFGDDPVQLTLSSNGSDVKDDENIDRVMLISDYNVDDIINKNDLEVQATLKGNR